MTVINDKALNRTQGSTKAAGLRILMIAPQPFFRARGTPFSVLHRTRALLKAGYTVDLLTYPFGENIDLPGNACTCPAATVGRRRCSHIRALQLHEQVGDVWAAEERARRRSEERRETDGPPLGDTKGREPRWPQDRKGRHI